ncbi:MAG TPA: hypothetical protein VII75_04615, partial [Thermoanaerobaculia bacterium]
MQRTEEVSALIADQPDPRTFSIRDQRFGDFARFLQAIAGQLVIELRGARAQILPCFAFSPAARGRRCRRRIRGLLIHRASTALSGGARVIRAAMTAAARTAMAAIIMADDDSGARASRPQSLAVSAG